MYGTPFALGVLSKIKDSSLPNSKGDRLVRVAEEVFVRRLAVRSDRFVRILIS